MIVIINKKGYLIINGKKIPLTIKIKDKTENGN